MYSFFCYFRVAIAQRMFPNVKITTHFWKVNDKLLELSLWTMNMNIFKKYDKTYKK